METIRSRRILSLVAALAIFMGLGLVASAPAQTCGTLLSQDTEHYPQYSGAIQDLLSTGDNDAYIYAATQWGFVRASLSNPSSPGPLKLMQVGGKTVSGTGTNGGLIPMVCDCGQGMSTFAVADAVGGTSKIVSNWIAPSWSTIDPGVAVQTSGGGDPSFGDILNVQPVGGSSQVAALYFPGTGKYFGYMPATGLGNGQGPVQIVDLTSLDGSPNLANARNPIGSFGWNGVFSLRAGTVSVGGSQKAILVGYVTSDATVRVAEINGTTTTGMPAQTASIAAPFGVAFSIANVNAKAYVFIAAGGAGLNVYEYTGTALNFAGNIPGSYDDVVVKGAPNSQYPAIFVHSSSPTDTIQIWDTKWLTAGTPVKAYSMLHAGSGSPTGRGHSVEAVVTGTGSSIIAHLYRMGNAAAGTTDEAYLITDNIDISCIAADTTSPPVANASFLNLSAQLQGRTGTNYYGDQVQFTDISSTGVPILTVDWDVLYPPSGPFVPDPQVLQGTQIVGYWPCDPANGGNFGSGQSCGTSVESPTGTQSFQFAERSANKNGVSANPFISSPITFLMPQIVIAGFSGNTLSVLTGGRADASGTQGNAPSFNWTFTPGGTFIIANPIVPSASGAQTFSLTVNWLGGYSSTVSGNVVQTSLVPDFSVVSPAIIGGKVSVSNHMLIAPAAQVTGIDWAVDQSPTGSTYSSSSTFTNNLAPSGTGNGTDNTTISTPATAGTWYLHLRYNYTVSGLGQAPVAVDHSFQVTIVTNVDLTCSPSTLAAGQTVTCTASGGSGSATYAWNWGDSYPPTFTAGGVSNSHVYTSGGTMIVTVQMTDGAAPVTGAFTVTVTGGGGGSLSASVSGPSSGSIGSPLTFSASPRGGTGSYQYAWACDYSVLGGSGQFVGSGQSTTCTYATNGSRVVAVRVTDTASAVAVGQTVVNIGGGGPAPGGLNVALTGPSTGAANAVLTYTAVATAGTGPYTYSWACDFNALAGSGQFTLGTSTKTCSFTNNGAHNVAASVTDSASATVVGTASTTISGPGLPSVQFTTTGPGAVSLSGSTYTVGLNQPVTFSASEANGSSYAWAFGDGSAAVGPNSQTVTKTYSAKGTLSAALSVTGNGNQVAGSNTANFTVQVVTPHPSGAFTVSGAQSNADGTVYTANVGDTITMTASEPHALSWGWIFGDNTTGASPGPGQPVQKAYSTIGSYTAKLLVTGDETNTTGLTISTFTINVVSCVSNGATLCLNGNRFRATVNWAVPDQNKTGGGNAVPLTGDTGYYWFFSPTNIELVLKVVDGRTFNGNFWVFYGALSDVQYDISIEDTTTGVIKTYHNPYHTTASVADINAFPGGSAGTSTKTPQAISSISVTCTPSPATVGQQVSCTATPAGTYGWTWGDESAFPAPYAAGPNPNTHTYTRAGTVSVSASPDHGVTAGSTPLSITTSAAGSLAATISGPVSGSTGTAMTFTGAATGGTAPYTYSWTCDYSAVSPNFTAGTATNPCTYTTTGQHTVGLKVTDSAAAPASFVATANVALSAPAGPGLPSTAFTIDGATLNTSSGRYETERGRTVTFTPAEQNASRVGWAFGDGSAAETAPPDLSVTHVYQQLGSLTGQILVYGDEVRTTGLNIASIPISVIPCAADAKTLCLNDGRFKVSVVWSSPTSNGFGTAVPVTSDTGEFWFLSSNNIELVLKVVDGTTFNGHFWVFYGALSNLQYTITVTDTTTGVVKTYENPQGTTASVADVNAF